MDGASVGAAMTREQEARGRRDGRGEAGARRAHGHLSGGRADPAGVDPLRGGCVDAEKDAGKAACTRAWVEGVGGGLGGRAKVGGSLIRAGARAAWSLDLFGRIAAEGGGAGTARGLKNGYPLDPDDRKPSENTKFKQRELKGSPAAAGSKPRKWRL